MRSRVIKAITFLGGIYFFLEFVLPKYIFLGDTAFELGAYHSKILKAVQVIFVMAIGLGVINLVRIHGYALIRKRPGWLNSLALIVSMALTIGFGLANWYMKEFHGGSEMLDRIFWKFIMQGVYQNLGSAMFSLLAFYIAYAAYRSFRVQSVEAGLMMVAAIVVMIGQIPLGAFISETIPQTRAWVLTRINVPVFRGIMFGSMIAGLAMAVRMWLSLERTSRD